MGNIGAARSGLARDIGSDIAGYGGQIGNLGRTEYDLASSQRRELSDLGGIARGVKETGLGRQYDQAQQNRFAPTQAASYVQGFLPQYQSGGTEINKTYGIPADPLSMGLGTFFNTYGSFAGNNQQGQNPNPYQTTQAYPQTNTNTSNNAATTGGNYGNTGGNYGGAQA